MMGTRDIHSIESHCQALCEALPLARIRNEREYGSAIDTLNELLDAGGADETHPLALAVHQLGETIAAYEVRKHPLPDMPPNEFLRQMMEERGLRQTDMTELGTQGVVSEILSGKRRLNVRQIAALAQRFGVPESVFF
jgi:HTH-type transcriptional regulator / antitoxin HigA